MFKGLRMMELGRTKLKETGEETAALYSGWEQVNGKL
jgi:hypothetical protein